MKTPTIEEVKEYFKDAKEVRCIWDNLVYDISNMRIFSENIDGELDIYASLNNDNYPYGVSDYVGLFGRDEFKKYAEIVSYKQKIEDMPDFEVWVNIEASKIDFIPNDEQLGAYVRELRNKLN